VEGECRCHVTQQFRSSLCPSSPARCFPHPQRLPLPAPMGAASTAPPGGGHRDPARLSDAEDLGPQAEEPGSSTRQRTPRGSRSGWVGGRWVSAAVQWGRAGTGGGQPWAMGWAAGTGGGSCSRASPAGQQTSDGSARAPGSLPLSSLCLAPPAHFFFCLIRLPSIPEEFSHQLGGG